MYRSEYQLAWMQELLLRRMYVEWLKHKLLLLLLLF